MAANFAVSVTIKAIDEVTKTINQVTGNASKQAASLKTLSQHVSEATSSPRKLTDSFSDLKREVSGVGHSLEMKRLLSDIKSGTEKAAGSFKLLGGAARDAFSVITKSGFIIGGLGFASSRMFDEISRSNIELKHSALQLNMTPDKLRSYRLSAESMGLPQNAMDSALSRINDTAFQFRVSGAAPSSLGAMNRMLPGTPISLLDEHKRQRSPELILGEFLDKLKLPQVSNATKVQFMNDFLGSSDLLSMAQFGSKGMHAKAAQFQGGDYKESDEATQKYLDANSKFNVSLRELKRVASIEILPGISKGLENLSSWIKEQGKELRELFKDIGEGIPREMSSALYWVHLFVRGLTLISRTIGLANLAFGLMTGAVLFKLGKAIKLLIPSMETLMGWGGRLKAVWKGVEGVFALTEMALANPITWLIAAIALLVSAFIYLGVVVYRNWDKIKEVWNRFKVNWKKDLSEFKKMIHETLDPLRNLIHGKITFSEFISQFRIGGQKEAPTENKKSAPRTLGDLFKSGAKQTSKVETPTAQVTVSFENLPKGARIDEPRGTSWVAIHAGYTTAGEIA